MPANAFPDTRWSVVLLAAEDGGSDAHDALAQLLSLYWYPLFGHLRARGHSHHEAEDLVQAFFMHVCEKQSFTRADRLKGSFRGFLLGCLRYFLANERDFAAAYKRGGRVRLVSIDTQESEKFLETDWDLNPDRTTERDFDLRWARLLTQRALQQLSEQHRERPEVFARLKGFLTASDDTPYDTVAAELGVGLSMIKTNVHRMRRQFRDILRREIALTVSAPHEIDEELRHLVHVLSSE